MNLFSKAIFRISSVYVLQPSESDDEWIPPPNKTKSDGWVFVEEKKEKNKNSSIEEKEDLRPIRAAGFLHPPTKKR